MRDSVVHGIDLVDPLDLHQLVMDRLSPRAAKAQDGFAEAHFNHIKPLGTTGNLHLLASDICNCGHLFLFSFCRLPGYARSIWRGNPTAGAAFPATGKGVLGELGDQLSVGHWLGVDDPTQRVSEDVPKNPVRFTPRLA